MEERVCLAVGRHFHSPHPHSTPPPFTASWNSQVLATRQHPRIHIRKYVFFQCPWGSSPRPAPPPLCVYVPLSFKFLSLYSLVLFPALHSMEFCCCPWVFRIFAARFHVQFHLDRCIFAYLFLPCILFSHFLWQRGSSAITATTTKALPTTSESTLRTYVRTYMYVHMYISISICM